MAVRGPVTTILDLVGDLRVEDVIATFDVEFDIPLRHWQAVGLLQLAQATLPVDAGDTAGLAERVGAFWCDIVRADVELDLRRGLAAVDDSKADAERLVAAVKGGFPAYVAARWHDGAGKIRYRVGSHALGRMNFDQACRLADDHGLWSCRPDLQSNRLRACFEEARQAAPDILKPRAGAIVEELRQEEQRCAAEARRRNIAIEPMPDSVDGRELLRGWSSLLHNLAYTLLDRDPAESWDVSRRASAISRRLGDGYREAQAVNHQAALIDRHHTALGRDRAEAVDLYTTVLALPWRRGRRIAAQNLARLRGGREGAQALARLLDELAAERSATDGAAGLDTDLQAYTVAIYRELAVRLATAEPDEVTQRLLRDSAARELVLARSVRQVIALPAYKRAYAVAVRPVYQRRLAQMIDESGPDKQHWEEALALVEESSGRELLDLMAGAGLPHLDPPPRSPSAEVAVVEPPTGRRSAVRRVADAALEADRIALTAREQEFEEMFLHRPLLAAPHDVEIARKAEMYVANHPGTSIVRYFTYGPDRETRLGAFVVREGVGAPVACGELAPVVELVADLAGVSSPGERHSRRIWELLVEPVRHALDGCRHLVVIPTDDLFAVPFHIASPGGYEQGSVPLGALVPLSQAVSLTAYLTRGRHLLRRQRVELDDDLAALVVRDAGLSAGELARAGWDPKHMIIAGTPPDGLTGTFRQCAPDWDGLAALAACKPEFFLYAGHGTWSPSYGELGPYLNILGVDGQPDRLTPYDVALRLRLPRNRLTVLGACLAGQGAATAGGDVVGFLRSFIAAGAGAVALPLWQVLDASMADTSGTLLAASRTSARSTGVFDVVEALHVHYREVVEREPFWIEYLPLALYT